MEANGIALNALHHKLFDLGAFTLSLDEVPRILVSREVHGGDFARQFLVDLHGSECGNLKIPLGSHRPSLSLGTTEKSSKAKLERFSHVSGQ